MRRVSSKEEAPVAHRFDDEAAHGRKTLFDRRSAGEARRRGRAQTQAYFIPETLVRPFIEALVRRAVRIRQVIVLGDVARHRSTLGEAERQRVKRKRIVTRQREASIAVLADRVEFLAGREVAFGTRADFREVWRDERSNMFRLPGIVACAVDRRVLTTLVDVARGWSTERY